MTSITEVAKKAKQKVSEDKEPVKVKGSINIDNKIYNIKKLQWEDGVDLWEDMMKRGLPSIGSCLDRLQHDELDGSPTTFTEALINLSRNLEGSTLRSYSVVLFEDATVDGVEFDLNEEFTGNYGAWRKLLVFALKENFESFFDKDLVQGMTTKVQEWLKEVTKESNPSTPSV